MRLLAVSFLALLLPMSCGSDEAKPDTVDGGSACGFSAKGHPDSVDTDVCASMKDYEGATLDACTACCTAGGFLAGGFINLGHCACATSSPVPATPGDCMAENATEDSCSKCCGDHGHLGYAVSTGVSCDCGPKTDVTACECATHDANGATTCDACCLDHGFLSDLFIGIGTAECRCVGF